MTTNSADSISESSFSNSCVLDSLATDSYVRESTVRQPVIEQLPQPPPLPPICNSDQDSIVRASAPPVATEEAVPQVPQSTLQITTCDGKHGKRESAGWLSSLVIHGLLIALLALFLAPVDFGGVGIQELVIRFSEKEAESLPSVTIANLSQEEPAEQPDIPLPPINQPASSLLDAELDVNSSSAISTGGTGAEGGGGTISNNDGSRGSFFGIDAYGHEFVYVLDMSGSMRGRRFKRATAELIRSVAELRKSQSFYVLMFNGSTVQMFDAHDRRPKSLSATADNKERLAMWLKSAFRGGSTDPRGALKIALQMNPSAIFMLSDGEFDEPTNKVPDSLVGSQSDAFSIVEAAFSEVPIHAIAFEDPKSCENMKRLAVMTGGEYRFTAFHEGGMGEESLAAARNALKRGDTATAEILMRELVASFGHTESGWQARKDLGEMLFESTQNALNNGDLEIAKEGLLRLVELDPKALVTQDMQTALLNAFLEQRSGQDLSSDTNTVTSMLLEVAEKFPQARIAVEIAEPAAEELLQQAKQLSAHGDTSESIAKLEKVNLDYPNTAAAKQSQVLLEEARDQALSRGRKIRQSQGLVPYIQYLRQLASTFRGTQLGRIATRSLEAEAMELLVLVRDANTNHDSESKDEAEQQIELGFASDPLIQRVRQEFAQREFKARDLLRRGTRYENTRSDERAISTYQKVLTQYAGTIAAKKAKDRLRQLTKTSDDVVDESSAYEALEIMLRQGE